MCVLCPQCLLPLCRAAAARCRQKKKQWVEGLEKKAKEIEVAHSTMQEEIEVLKEEIANLTNILLAHRDCPLLMSQQEQLKQLRTSEWVGLNSFVLLLYTTVIIVINIVLFEGFGVRRRHALLLL